MKEMNANDIIKKIEDFAEKSTSEFDSGHDWWHLQRVRNIALYLHRVEKAGDRMVIEISALLHDIEDKKFRKTGDKGAEMAITELLRPLGVNDKIVNKVIQVNKYISFSSRVNIENKFPEFMIVQDADRLDAIGAIGIARAFNYGAFRNNAIYIPESEGSPNTPSTIGHFYDKLLKLKDMMNTTTARKIAVDRHAFLELFLERFYLDWNLGNEPKGGLSS
jgi:uncharacterized protein